MFKVNDYVVYGSTGVCQITDIVVDQYINGDEAEYYVLHPVYNKSMTIKIPVNSPNILLRSITTKDDVLSLIAKMPEIETILVDNEIQRLNHFKAALKTGKNEECIKVIKTLYLEREEKLAINKKLTKTDEDIMNIAEKRLNEEFAIVLNISPDEVIPYIFKHISNNKKHVK